MNRFIDILKLKNMNRHWQHTVRELNSAGIIDDDTVARIKAYYNNKESALSNRQLLIFGILGSVLVGLGIILIIAHNWDNFSRLTKAFFAFIPIITGQMICAYALLKHKKNTLWKESGSIFLFFAIGAAMALISQIYHLPGDLGDFVFTWMILSLPLIYLLKSSGTSLFYITGITFYACEVGYWSYNNEVPWLYWALFAAVIPYYVLLIRNSRLISNFAYFHHWIIPLSLVITLGTMAGAADELMFIAYMALLSFLFLAGRYFLLRSENDFFNSYQVIGSAGILILLLVFSFQGNWKFIEHFNMGFNEMLLTNAFWIIIIFSLAVTVILLRQAKKMDWMEYNIAGYALYIYILAFFLASYDPLNAVILINLFLFFQGVLIVRQGAVTNHLGILNYGLLIISALIACRFFDVKITFIMRGILFLVVGVSFFILNYRIIQRRNLK
jgi:uncharacterized membrane protein